MPVFEGRYARKRIKKGLRGQVDRWASINIKRRCPHSRRGGARPPGSKQRAPPHVPPLCIGGSPSVVHYCFVFENAHPDGRLRIVSSMFGVPTVCDRVPKCCQMLAHLVGGALDSRGGFQMYNGVRSVCVFAMLLCD